MAPKPRKLISWGFSLIVHAALFLLIWPVGEGGHAGVGRIMEVGMIQMGSPLGTGDAQVGEPLTEKVSGTAEAIPVPKPQSKTAPPPEPAATATAKTKSPKTPTVPPQAQIKASTNPSTASSQPATPAVTPPVEKTPPAASAPASQTTQPASETAAAASTATPAAGSTGTPGSAAPGLPSGAPNGGGSPNGSPGGTGSGPGATAGEGAGVGAGEGFVRRYMVNSKTAENIGLKAKLRLALSIWVNKNGEIYARRVEVVQSTGNPEIDRSIIKQVNTNWIFNPPPFSVLLHVAIIFSPGQDPKVVFEDQAERLPEEGAP